MGIFLLTWAKKIHLLSAILAQVLIGDSIGLQQFFYFYIVICQISRPPGGGSKRLNFQKIFLHLWFLSVVTVNSACSSESHSYDNSHLNLYLILYLYLYLYLYFRLCFKLYFYLYFCSSPPGKQFGLGSFDRAVNWLCMPATEWPQAHISHKGQCHTGPFVFLLYFSFLQIVFLWYLQCI